MWDFSKTIIRDFYIYEQENKKLKKVRITCEVIEEDKKIEKITIREKTIGFPNGEWTARNMDKAFAYKINALIDELNKLKEEK